jgi:hypothetical protein
MGPWSESAGPRRWMTISPPCRLTKKSWNLPDSQKNLRPSDRALIPVHFSGYAGKNPTDKPSPFQDLVGFHCHLNPFRDVIRRLFIMGKVKRHVVKTKILGGAGGKIPDTGYLVGHFFRIGNKPGPGGEFENAGLTISGDNDISYIIRAGIPDFASGVENIGLLMSLLDRKF